MAKATSEELLAARIVFRAVLPVIKVLLEDVPKLGQKFAGVTAKVQFVAKNDPEDAACCLQFTDGALEVVPGLAENPDLTLRFSSVAKMNAFFAGKPALPWISGLFSHFGLLVKIMTVLLAMKLMQPNAKPKTEDEKKLKVKLTVYMISTALSQLNKSGDEEMVKWTTKQPERIYQWSCEPEGVAAYLRIKAGKSKAGRGYYTRRKPFVHLKFDGATNALPVLSNSIDMIQAMAKGMIVIDGSPEYAAVLGNFMVRIARLVS
ncbi:MAG: hypothetical protein QG656_2758 [Candidatus Hydrogenedentes bacterium]|nr:hypothetical protein [Candidatus Hydrogenedentota bacterium]